MPEAEQFKVGDNVKVMNEDSVFNGTQGAIVKIDTYWIVVKMVWAGNPHEVPFQRWEVTKIDNA